MGDGAKQEIETMGFGKETEHRSEIKIVTEPITLASLTGMLLT